MFNPFLKTNPDEDDEICPEHSQTCAYSCLDCNFLTLCPLCAEGGFHSRHHLRDISRAGEQAEITISSLLVKLKARVELLELETDRLSIKKVDLFDRRKDLHAKLQQAKSELGRLLAQRIAELTDNLNALVEEELSGIENEIRQLRQSSRKMVGWHNSLEQVTKSDSRAAKCRYLSLNLDDIACSLSNEPTHNLCPNLIDLSAKVDLTEVKRVLKDWSVSLRCKNPTVSGSSVQKSTQVSSKKQGKGKGTTQGSLRRSGLVRSGDLKRKGAMKSQHTSYQTSPRNSLKRRVLID